MKNKTLKRIVSWLIIASPIWWVAGCYTMSEIDFAAPSGKNDLEVVTRGQNTYTFHQWKVDSLGAIRGIATWTSFQITGRSKHKIEHTRTAGSIPLDSVKTIRSSQFNLSSTILLGLGVVAAAGLVVGIIAVGGSGIGSIGGGGGWGSMGMPGL